ncbi:DUF4232 domain-containing protein [Nonomuraea sp. NPDC000554]|uniref:DUF4232 domain-containing protein n=1 Tax=Nonomuraea sp. NPDC000554 TaxID=3154259 RepID=UPI003320EC9B
MRIAALMAGGLLLAGGAAPALAQQTPERCTASRLQVRLDRVDPGAGNRYAPLVFTNRSGASCTLYGHPGLVMIDGKGDALRTRVRRGTEAERELTLKPGASARATLHWTVVETGAEKTCPTATRLLVIPPDERSYLTIGFPAGRVCDDGRLDVTPLS